MNTQIVQALKREYSAISNAIAAFETLKKMRETNGQPVSVEPKKATHSNGHSTSRSQYNLEALAVGQERFIPRVGDEDLKHCAKRCNNAVWGVYGKHGRDAYDFSVRQEEARDGAVVTRLR